MGNSRRLRRQLNKKSVEIANNLQLKKHELAMQMVAERVKRDAEFAADVLKIGGELLRADIKRDAEETILRQNKETLPSENDPSITDDDLETALKQHCIGKGNAIPDVRSEVIEGIIKTEILDAIKKHRETSTEQLENVPEAIRIANGDRTHELVSETTDGGKEILVEPIQKVGSSL